RSGSIFRWTILDSNSTLERLFGSGGTGESERIDHDSSTVWQPGSGRHRSVPSDGVNVAPRKNELTHVDKEGRARMVDVTEKAETVRVARAEAFVEMSADTVRLLRERQMPKGDPLEVARIAGIQAGKKTSELIPLCHPLALTHLDVSIEIT